MRMRRKWNLSQLHCYHLLLNWKNLLLRSYLLWRTMLWKRRWEGVEGVETW